METPTARDPILPPRESVTPAQPDFRVQPTGRQRARERCPSCGSAAIRYEVEADQDGIITARYCVCEGCLHGWTYACNEVQPTGGEPPPEAVEQAAREDGHVTAWTYSEKPAEFGGPAERVATLKLGGLDLTAHQTETGFRYLVVSQDNWDFCTNRTFDQIVADAPFYTLPILTEALARLRRIVHGGLIGVEPMRDAEAPDPAVAEVDGCDALKMDAME